MCREASCRWPRHFRSGSMGFSTFPRSFRISLQDLEQCFRSQQMRARHVVRCFDPGPSFAEVAVVQRPCIIFFSCSLCATEGVEPPFLKATPNHPSPSLGSRVVVCLTPLLAGLSHSHSFLSASSVSFAFSNLSRCFFFWIGDLYLRDLVRG